MTNKDKLEMNAIKAFKKHWIKIVKNLVKSETNYADNLIHCFEADTRGRKKILARRFYGLDHAKEMASMSEKEIKENLSCYLPRSIEYALDWEDQPEIFIRKLVSSQYVMFYFPLHEASSSIERYDEDSFDLWVDHYPNKYRDGDDYWYERSVGRAFKSYTILILMKSTGESFSKIEMTWLKKSIQYNIDNNEPDALWWFQCHPIAKNKLWIKIYQFTNKSDYINGFLWEEGFDLSAKNLRKFVCQMIEYLSQQNKPLKNLSVFNNYKTMKKKDLFDLTNVFFKKNAKKLDGLDIRSIEDIMNNITGRKDRDYQADSGYLETIY